MESLFDGRNLFTDHWSGRLLFQRHVHNQQGQVLFFFPLSLLFTRQQDGTRRPRVQDPSDDIELVTMPTPPVLAYARHHGLCIDHEAQDVLQLLDVLTPIPEDHDLKDPNHSDLDLQKFIKVDLEEPKIQLTLEEGMLLAKNIRPPPDFQVNWSDFLPDPRRKERMKLEVPILATDHDQDMEEFKSEMKSRQE